MQVFEVCLNIKHILVVLAYDVGWSRFCPLGPSKVPFKQASFALKFLTTLINKKLLQYSTGNYIQSPGIDHDGKEYKKNVYICITDSLCWIADTGTTLYINNTLIKKKKNPASKGT